MAESRLRRDSGTPRSVRAQDPGYIADHIRRLLLDGGSAPYSEEVQRFFQEHVRARGWHTHELRMVATRVRRAILKSCDLAYLLQVADELFRGEVLEEKAIAVEMVRGGLADCRESEFRRFVSWIGRVSCWADHDALVHCLIGPMMLAEPKRTVRVFAWARSKDRWHRRAAAVALIRGARSKAFFREIQKTTEMLREDQDDMVQKGLGWLLREAAKADPGKMVPFLLRIRERIPRFVLRTACETLTKQEKQRVLGVAAAKAAAS